MRIVIAAMLVACAGNEDRSTLDSVPQAATAAMMKQSGGIALHKVDRELEGGVERYEATWFVAGRRHELTVTADGRVVELDIEVPESEVPAAVRATAEREVGRGAKYERLRSGNYEAELVVDGREHEVVITPQGEVVGREHDDDDGDDD